MKSSTTRFAALLALSTLSIPTLSVAAETNLALGKPDSSSSEETAGRSSSNAVDGSGVSRWASERTDDQWLAVDLGDRYALTGVTLHWEAAYGRHYHIQVSDDGENWTTAHTTTNGDGDVDSLSLDAVGRHVRMKGVERGTSWGYSLWEMEVHGAPYVPEPDVAGANLAEGRSVLASTEEGNSRSANNAVDNDLSSRWASGRDGTDWIAVDLGSLYSLSSVALHWEAAYAKKYQIQVSSDGDAWTTVSTISNGNGGVDEIDLQGGVGRYVRMNGLERGTNWGYSLYEFEVYGQVSIPDSVEVAAGKTATASSGVSGNLAVANAFDGSSSSRWSSSYNDNEWLAVDLGSVHNITGVNLSWEQAYGKDYDLQVSHDGASWSTVHSTRGGTGGEEAIELNGVGRYVRMKGIARGTNWGYSLYEMEVLGYRFDYGDGDHDHGGSSSSSSSSSSGGDNHPDATAPTTPGTLTVAGVTTNSVTYGWGAASDNVGVVAYAVYRGGNKLTEVPASTRAYTDTGLSAGTTYGYRVRAVDAADNWSSYSSTLTVSTDSEQVPSTGAILEWVTPDSRENGDYLELDDIGGYEIRYTLQGANEPTVVVLNGSSATRHTVESLNIVGEFEIAAFDTDGLYSEFVVISPR